MIDSTETPFKEPPTFSVVIPTRNRPHLVARALHSVLAQTITDMEVIVVDDGSDEKARGELLALLENKSGVRLLQLPARPHGHGPAFVRNVGAEAATGRYLCFLDDDDLWIDPHHLRRARSAIQQARTPIDLYFTHQQAVYSSGKPNPNPLWLSGLETLSEGPEDAEGNRKVSVSELLRAPGFAHLNCSIYRRQLYDAIDGMDEAQRYENDRDIYFRAIDAATHIVFNPAVVAQHHIPDASKRDNVSTAVHLLEKKIYQLRLCDKAILQSRTPALRRHARRAKGYTLKAIADQLIASGQHRDAVYYMREALLVSFSFGWLAYTLYVALLPDRSAPNGAGAYIPQP